MLKNNNIDPEVILYLENPLNQDQINNILNLLDLQPRDIMRKKEAEYKDNNLTIIIGNIYIFFQNNKTIMII